MASALKGFVGLIIFVYVFAYGVNFISGGRKVSEPREIGSEQITPPGTELQIGEEAFVPHRDTRYGKDRDGIVAITVTSIEEGDQDLFQQRVENSEGLKVYYIEATVENVSQEDLGTAVFGLDLVGPDGSGASLMGGDLRNPGLGDCRSKNFPDSAKVGTFVETCEIDAIRSGSSPGGAKYARHDTPYAADPIIWRR